MNEKQARAEIERLGAVCVVRTLDWGTEYRGLDGEGRTVFVVVI
jgi:hypothetical protein